MKMNIIRVLFIPILFSSCISSKNSGRLPETKIHLGISQGGIIENTDFEVYTDVPVDAYSGATKTGISAGIRYLHPLRTNSIQTGFDVLYNKQIFTYNDPVNLFHGQRELGTTQLRIPLLYTFSFINTKADQPLINLGIGISTGLIFCNEISLEGQLPTYSINHLSLGPVLDFEILPVRFSNGSAIGFTGEFSRSFSKSYDDFYQQGEMPGVSYMKFGVVYKLR